MRSARGRHPAAVAAPLLSAALLAATAVALPAHAVSGRTVVSTDRDAARPVYDISSDPAGTVFVTDGGAVRLVRAPMTPGSAGVDLGTRGPGDARLPAQEVSIQGGRVAIPMLSANPDALATTVRWCLVADCPATTTFTAPAGYRYLGNAGDAAVLHNRTTNTLALSPWTGGALTTRSLGTLPAPFGAYGDANGIALWHGTRAAYVARPSLTVTPIAGRRAYLTPSFVVFSTQSGQRDSYTVSRVPRATPGAPPAVLATVPAVSGDEPARVVGTDDAVAWAAPLLPPRARKDTGTQVQTLFTMTVGGEPAESGRVEWSALAPFEDRGTFLVHRTDAPTGRGFYAVAPETAAAVRVHELPAVAATVHSVAVSHGRVIYADDSQPEGAAYLREIDGAVPGPETLVRTPASDVALSGPFVAVAHDDETTTVGAFSNETTYAGRAGAPLATFSTAEDLDLSGRRLVLQRPGNAELVAVAGSYDPVATSRGNVTGAVFGDHFYAADDNGGISRRNLLTDALRTVRTGTCGGHCGNDRSTWQFDAWDDQLMYALDLGSHGRVTGLWDASTGTTTALPMLAAGWTEVRYRDGLLLRYRAGEGVRLYDVATGAHRVVDATGTLPSGNGLDDRYVAWVSADGDAVVQPITDFFPAYDSTPLHLNSIVPVGFGPGLQPSVWTPRWFTSEEVSYTLTLRRESADGPVTRTFSGTSERGEVAEAWDGTDGDGDPAPAGWYHWTLSGDAPTRTGRVFLSRDPLPTPVVTAPVLVSDVSTNGRFRISWTGVAPDYAHYAVWRGRDGYPPTRVAATRATSLVVDAKDLPTTFRFEVYVEDPAGRAGLPGRATTVTPVDDAAGTRSGSWVRRYDSRLWRGSQLRSATPGSKLAFAAKGDGVWVVGTRGPGYGRYRVTVDGTRSFTYDAYAATTRYRQVLFKLGGLDGAVAHRVVVEPLATVGRTLVGVDGVAFRKKVVTQFGH